MSICYQNNKLLNELIDEFIDLINGIRLLLFCFELSCIFASSVRVCVS